MHFYRVGYRNLLVISRDARHTASRRTPARKMSRPISICLAPSFRHDVLQSLDDFYARK